MMTYWGRSYCIDCAGTEAAIADPRRLPVGQNVGDSQGRV